MVREETRLKLNMSTKAKQLEDEKSSLQEQLDEEEAAKRGFEKMIAMLQGQVSTRIL